MIILMLMVVMVMMVVPAVSLGCVNSCCQSCVPEQCSACYKLNTNPVMCPCLGDLQTEQPANKYSERLQNFGHKTNLPRLSKFQLSSKSSVSVLG